MPQHASPKERGHIEPWRAQLTSWSAVVLVVQSAGGLVEIDEEEGCVQEIFKLAGLFVLAFGGVLIGERGYGVSVPR